MQPTTGSKAGRNGNWIQTISGRAFWPLDPRSEEIDIDDITWALSMQCRFAGHVRQFYSVAEHSVHVSFNVPAEYALWGLLHDATEAYLTDLVQPLKVCIPQYKEWEDALMQCICHRFNLTWPMPPEVKSIDYRILFTEKQVLLNPCEREWSSHAEPLSLYLPCWSPAEAQRYFKSRFMELHHEPT